MAGMNFLKKAAVDAGKVTLKEPEPEKKTFSLKSGVSSLSSSTSQPEAPKSLAKTSLFGTKPKDDGQSQQPGHKNFLKKGAAAKAQMEQAQAMADAAKEKAGTMFEFRMKGGEDRKITFLDGDLDADGCLDITTYYEHTIKIGNSIDTYVCTSEEDPSQPCPLCAAGEKRYLAGLMTVIDHTPYTIKTGPKAGQVVEHQRKLYKCKHATIKVLTKYASKNGGLTGWTYDVSRSGGDKSPAVGDTFMPDFKWESPKQFAQLIGVPVEEVMPADYNKEVIYKSPEQLAELGIGKSFTGVGTKKGGTVDTGSLKSQL
jgi:hypothetical protein